MKTPIIALVVGGGPEPVPHRKAPISVSTLAPRARAQARPHRAHRMSLILMW